MTARKDGHLFHYPITMRDVNLYADPATDQQALGTLKPAPEHESAKVSLVRQIYSLRRTREGLAAVLSNVTGEPFELQALPSAEALAYTRTRTLIALLAEEAEALRVLGQSLYLSI